MKRLFTLLVAAFMSTHADCQNVLARWNFESVVTSNTGTTASVSSGSAVADSGIITTGSAFSAVHASASTVWSNPAGNGSSKSVSSNNWGVGDYYQFLASTTGYNGISISFDQLGSNTGPGAFKVQYSTNGTTFNDFTGNTYTIPAATWSTSSSITTTAFSFDLSTVTALNNAATVYFRLVDNGTVSVNGSTVATTGTGRVDNFTINALGTLPVTLKAFTASLVNNQPSLTWVTSNETNFNYFGVEKSLDAKNFVEIGKVTSNKTANGSAYTYNEVSKAISEQYYRLKLVDNDGSFKYSNLVSLTGKEALSVMAYPNPVTDVILLSHPKAAKGAFIQLTGIDGRNITNIAVAAGATQTSLSISKFVKGSYIAVYQNAGVKQSTQFIKQ